MEWAIDAGSEMRAVGRSSDNPFVTEPPRPAQVAVVDDHVLVGRLVVSLVERAGYSCEFAFRETEDATWSAVMAVDPQLLLLDFDLGPGQSSTDVLTKAVGAGIVVAGFTGSDDRLEHAHYLEAGAAAVVPKGAGPADLVAVVELALAGEELMAPSDRHAALARLRKWREERRRRLAVFESLTDREAQTLVLIAEGLGAADIVEQWQVALPTVRTHIRAVLTKLGVTSQLQAAALARDSGWYARIAQPGSSILTMPIQEEAGTIARRSGSTG